MGTIFTYVADDALTSIEDACCHVCGCDDVPIYDAQGDIEQGDEELDVSEACAKCIKTGKIIPTCEFELQEVIRKYIANHQNSEGTELEANLIAARRRTPSAPTHVQREDWPLCCDDLTEYRGTATAADGLLLKTQGTYWNGEPQNPQGRRRIDVEELVAEPLAVLGAINVFRCLHCASLYWTFQHT